MNTVCGYINGPPGDTQACAIYVDNISTWIANVGTLTFSSKANNRHASCILTKTYYPVGYQGGRRESFIGGVPFKCEAGQCLMLNPCECLALAEAGAAIFSHGSD